MKLSIHYLNKSKEKVNLNKSTKQLSNKMKQKHIQPGLSIKDHLLAAAKKSTVDVTTKIIPFSLKGLQNIYRNKPNDSQVCYSKKPQLIGQLKSCGMWCCCHGNEIHILNHHRIQETILYHKLMSNHILQYQQLETPIVLSESNVGGPGLWKILKTIATKEQTCSTYSFITDQRLIGNGINIKYHIGRESEDLQAEVTGLCNIIPTYGLSDLVEILELIANTNADTLSKSRPLKVINYLQGEAVRMARQLPRQQTADEIEDLMEQILTELPSECCTCLHNKPFYHKLYDINDIPLTQTQV
ncbi:hypothetical protein KUTeg_008183 [Tegillarca granosa]|uniref:Uncharacterized protein n=1 Tax=Tegillarca granosa TaxID=220873 RepID=A0ABQ9FB69_TEGGR|nr:hypothetical protein KUTeg_008183 [Tegillarca granosa]